MDGPPGGGEASPKSSIESGNVSPEQTDDFFAAIEKDYNKTLYELEKDEATIPFIDNFSKMFQSLFKTYTSERELAAKCIEYKERLDNDKIQLELSAKSAERDSNTIQDLETKVEQTRKIADTAHARELAAQDLIDNLRAKVSRLSDENEMLKKMASQQDVDESPEMIKTKETLQRDKEKLQADVNQLELRLSEAIQYHEEIERKLSNTNLFVSQLTNELQTLMLDQQSQKKKYESLEDEKNEFVQKFKEKETEARQLKENLDLANKHGNKMEAKNKEIKLQNEKILKESELLVAKMQKLHLEFEAHQKLYYELQLSYNMKLNDLKNKENELKRLYNDVKSYDTKVEQLEKKLQKAESVGNAVHLDREKLRQNINGMEREIELIKRAADADKRDRENIIRERDILNKNILRNEAVARDHLKLIRISEQTKKKLQVEVETLHSESHKQKSSILNLEKERDRLTEETLELTKKIRDVMEEVRTKKEEIVVYLKKIEDCNITIRTHKTMFEAVRSEKNAVQKTLQEVATECVELKNKLKISNHLLEQLKEDIAGKQNIIVKGENVIKKLTKEKENLKIDINNNLDTIRTLNHEIMEAKAEEKRLHRVILNHEVTIKDKNKEIEGLSNERDIIGTQLVRRNDELTLLYEKISILESTLQRGEAQYDQRLDDIKLLKTEIKRLRIEKNLLCKSITNATDLRVEVFHLERDLTRERLKCRALEEEIQNPLNVHRWRKLEGSDPELLELIQKIQLLQKRLLKQSSEGIERERQLRECEKMYLNLKQILAKQPGPAVMVELTKTQRVLKYRGKQMKCLVSELNMYESQNTEYKLNVEKLTNELQEIKKKYLALKKNHSNCGGQLPPIATSASNRDVNNQRSSGSFVRFTGGGYRMSISSNAELN